MRIKSIASTQFAGVRDVRADLEGGLNVICGRNESGKSTLVDLLGRTLFQRAKLDRRRDKSFYSLYFPAALRSGASPGDLVDGSVTLETTDGVYTVTREWGADPRSRLVTPYGVLRDEDAIERELRAVLGYGEGVYSELLFASGQASAAALASLLDDARQSPAKRDLTEAVTRTFAEVGGASVDAIERAIRAKIALLEGAHWDEERQAPVRSSRRWVRETGEILAAYYALEDAQNELRELSALEDEAARRARRHASAAAEAEEAALALEAFRVYAGRLDAQNERREHAAALERELASLSDAARRWPDLRDGLARAKGLRDELAHRTALDRWAAVRELSDDVRSLERELSGMPCPTEAEVRAAAEALRARDRAESALRGLDLTARIHTEDGHTAEVRALRTGALVPTEGESARLTEAVSIAIPGVAQIVLSPADTDAEALERELERARTAAAAVLERYDASDLASLEDKRRAHEDRERALETARMRLRVSLDGAEESELEAAAAASPSGVRAREEILSDAAALCGGAELTRTIAAWETLIERYTAAYGSPEALDDMLSERREKLASVRALMEEGEDIPEGYRAVAAPRAHLDALKTAAADARAEAERTLADMSEASGALLQRREGLEGDPAEQVEAASRWLDEVKELLAHWKHIEAVFLRRKQALTGEPMRGLAERFETYLAAISGGTLTAELAERDRPDVRIFSADRRLGYELLSEGTKESAALAFRLAVLDRLFPEGGVVVLDDPLVNMDDERTDRACALLREVAERHQVIFLTCREAYLDRLGGNRILL